MVGLESVRSVEGPTVAQDILTSTRTGMPRRRSRWLVGAADSPRSASQSQISWNGGSRAGGSDTNCAPPRRKSGFTRTHYAGAPKAQPPVHQTWTALTSRLTISMPGPLLGLPLLHIASARLNDWMVDGYARSMSA